MSIECPKCGARKNIIHNIPDPYGRKYREWHFCKHCSMMFVKNNMIKVRTIPSPSVPIRTDIPPEKTALEIVAIELGKAKGKHPYFPSGAEGLSIIAEELGELAAAINDKESKERLIEEAAHVAATAIRFIEEQIK